MVCLHFLAMDARKCIFAIRQCYTRHTDDFREDMDSDSEYMAGQLAAYGYNLTQRTEEADLWLLSSCTVKNPSEDTFRNEIASGMASGKLVVVAGCVPQGVPKAYYLRGMSVIGVQQIDRVVEAAEERLKGHSVRLLQCKKEQGKRVAGARLALPEVRVCITGTSKFSMNGELLQKEDNWTRCSAPLRPGDSAQQCRGDKLRKYVGVGLSVVSVALLIQLFMKIFYCLSRIK